MNFKHHALDHSKYLTNPKSEIVRKVLQLLSLPPPQHMLGLLFLADPAISLCGLRLVHTRQRRIIGGENSLR